MGRQLDEEDELMYGNILPNNDAPKPLMGWSKFGVMVNNDKQKTVQLQADFPEAGTYTVQFLLVQREGTAIRARAIITWSVAGNSQTRIVDVANGVSVSGTAEGVAVRVIDAGYNPGSDEYNVTVLVSKGVRASNETPPTLTPDDPFPLSIPAGTIGNIPIDTKAGIKSVMVGIAAALAVPYATGTVHIKFLDTAAAYLASYYPQDTPTWLPLPPGTRLISIANDSAVTIEATVTFGIDG